MATTVVAVLEQCRQRLEEGAAMTVDEGTVRVHILPLRR